MGHRRALCSRLLAPRQRPEDANCAFGGVGECVGDKGIVAGLVGLGSGALLASGCTQGGCAEDNHFCNLYYLATVPAGAGLGILLGL